MLEFRVFKSRTFTVSMILVVLAWSSFMGSATMLPMFMQNVAGFSALYSGMTLMASVSSSAMQAGVERSASLGFDAACWTMVALNAVVFVASLLVLRRTGPAKPPAR